MTIELDDAQVERVARRVIRARRSTLVGYELRPLTYDAYRPGRTVVVVDGVASVDGRHEPWSAVLKSTDSVATTPGAPVEQGRREADAYRSGLLEALAGLAAPRPYVIDVAEDGRVALWLEHVRDDGPDEWPLETYAIAARALGRSNGTFLLRPLPEHPWLVPDWAARQSEPLDVAVARVDIARRAADPRARRALGRDVEERVTRMLEDQPRFIADLARLPQTLCHHDAARSNLIARRPGDRELEIVAIDWESIGPGALGAEIATLVSGSLRKGDFPAARASELDAAVVDAYVAGLRDAGWTGDVRLVRLGYAMSLALRSWFVRDTLRSVTAGDARPVVGRRRVPADDAVAAFAAISRFLLDRADEARSLASSLLR